MTAPVRVAIVAAAFNEAVVGTMIREATAEVRVRQAELLEIVRVPGAYELVLPARALLARPEVDLLVVLGFIERGETLHGEVMGHVVHQALMQLELAAGKPIGLGIIGPGATTEQASTRQAAYARAAVSAGFALLETMRGMSKAEGSFVRPRPKVPPLRG